MYFDCFTLLAQPLKICSIPYFSLRPLKNFWKKKKKKHFPVISAMKILIKIYLQKSPKLQFLWYLNLKWNNKAVKSRHVTCTVHGHTYNDLRFPVQAHLFSSKRTCRASKLTSCGYSTSSAPVSPSLHSMRVGVNHDKFSDQVDFTISHIFTRVGPDFRKFDLLHLTANWHGWGLGL